MNPPTKRCRSSSHTGPRLVPEGPRRESEAQHDRDEREAPTRRSQQHGPGTTRSGGAPQPATSTDLAMGWTRWSAADRGGRAVRGREQSCLAVTQRPPDAVRSDEGQLRQDLGASRQASHGRDLDHGPVHGRPCGSSRWWRSSPPGPRQRRRSRVEVATPPWRTASIPGGTRAASWSTERTNPLSGRATGHGQVAAQVGAGTRRAARGVRRRCVCGPALGETPLRSRARLTATRARAREASTSRSSGRRGTGAGGCIDPTLVRSI